MAALAVPREAVESALSDARTASGVLRRAYAAIQDQPDLSGQCHATGTALKHLVTMLEARLDRDAA